MSEYTAFQQAAIYFYFFMICGGFMFFWILISKIKGAPDEK